MISIKRKSGLFVMPMVLFSAANFASEVCAPLKLENWEPGCFLQHSHQPPLLEYLHTPGKEFIDFNSRAEGLSSDAQENVREYSLLREEWRSLESKKTS
jgi:hypothetical protein